MERTFCVFDVDNYCSLCTILLHILLHPLPGSPTLLTQIPLDSKSGRSQCLDYFLNEKLEEDKNEHEFIVIVLYGDRM